MKETSFSSAIENKASSAEKKEESGAFKPETASRKENELKTRIGDLEASMQRNSGDIAIREEGIVKIRQELGLPALTQPIPAVEQIKNEQEKQAKQKAELEKKLQEIISQNLADEYRGVIEEVRNAKIDWAQSPELARRLTERGASAEEVAQVKEWLVTNAQGLKVFVLPPALFREAVEVLHEMAAGQSNLHEAAAFHIGERGDVPESVRNSVVVSQKIRPPMLPIPGRAVSAASQSGEGKTGLPELNKADLVHEMGHGTENGLLDSGLYHDWKAPVKEGAPDPEYIGLIQETDVRIRSMFNDLADIFDPAKQRFDENTLALLKKRREEGKLEKNTLDLLRHYDDRDIIDLANYLPAI